MASVRVLKEECGRDYIHVGIMPGHQLAQPGYHLSHREAQQASSAFSYCLA